MAKNMYWATSLTGGGVGALDRAEMDGDNLNDLDGAIVITLPYTLFYSLDADSGATESSPTVIAPDLNPGAKRWILTGISEIPAAAMKQLKNIGTTEISAAQWGIVGALTTHPLGGDGTAGRIPRALLLKIDNGTDDATLKCTITTEWNGDAIAETDNIAKGATTGYFTLDATGKLLSIENTGLSGIVLYALSNFFVNQSGTNYKGRAQSYGGDICVRIYHPTTGLSVDMTTIVDGGYLLMDILYITSA